MTRTTLWVVGALLCATASVSADDVSAVRELPVVSGADTISAKEMEEVVVQAIRTQANAPFAVANIGGKELERFSRTGQELPFLFARTPGVIAWGENGLGTGTTYLRIRGAGDSRVNVTIDGVPLNSPEDQCVFWANMNSYAALLGSVQIQRGVGTSTNGDGAFGGTVSLSTRTPLLTPGGELTGSFGSYGTWKAGARFSTGLIGKHIVIDGAYNETNTDGYVHGTDGRSGSYYGGLTWMGENFTIRYKNIGNFETTGQAWNGVIAGDYDGYAPLDVTYADLYRMGYGRWNSLCENIHVDQNGAMCAEPYVMKDGTVWRHTTDHFRHNHSILSAVWRINDNWHTTASLRYTRGYGYYREFKHNNKLSKYGLPNLTLADGSTLKKTDFVRKKGLSQDHYGVVWNATYSSRWLDFAAGLSAQRFRCDHFGFLTYMGNDELSALYLTGGAYRYYDSDATKDDVSAFAKATRHLTDRWDAFLDLQYRHVRYKTGGYNDKYYADLSRNYLDIDKHYNFFNPKAGIAYHSKCHKAYLSLALSHREPERNNFTDNGMYPAPTAEGVVDMEMGYEYAASRWHAGVNLYYMDYEGQFVQTGAVSDIGEALTTNIRQSYRMGVELTAGVNIFPWLTLDGNLAWSRNRLKDFDEVVEDWTAADGTRTVHYDGSTLAYSPSLVSNLFLTCHHKGFRATWHTGYVSRMYVDNSASAERSVPAYCASDFSASYTFRLWRTEVELGGNVCNVFNRHYAQSGFVWYQYYDDNGRHSQMSYIPSAGTTVLATLALRF